MIGLTKRLQPTARGIIARSSPGTGAPRLKRDVAIIEMLLSFGEPSYADARYHRGQRQRLVSMRGVWFSRNAGRMEVRAPDGTSKLTREAHRRPDHVHEQVLSRLQAGAWFPGDGLLHNKQCRSLLARRLYQGLLFFSLDGTRLREADMAALYRREDAMMPHRATPQSVTMTATVRVCRGRHHHSRPRLHHR